MQAYLQSSTQKKQTPKLIKFGADVVECLAFQTRWQLVESLGPLKIRGHLRQIGVPKELAKAMAIRYDRHFYRYLPFAKGTAIPQNGIYCSRDKLKEAVARLWVHHFMPPEKLVRAAFIIARQGREDEISGCRCYTNDIPTSGPSGLGAIRVSVAESIEEPGLLVAASIAEVFGNKCRTIVVHSIVQDRVAHSRFQEVGGDSCMKVLAKAKKAARPEDFRDWIGKYAARFGFA